MEINKIAFFTKDYLTTAIEHLRVLAPLTSTGMKVKRYVFDAVFKLESIEPCDIIVIQRDFAGNYLQYEELMSFAKQHRIPVVLDLDDNLLALPLSHPDRQSLCYTESLTPLLQSMAEVDAITVTNKALQEEVKQYNDTVFVLPNYLDESIWQFKPQKTSNNNEVIKILYMGSHSHRPDLDMIANALEIILNIYPNVQFYCYGLALPKTLTQHIRAHHLPAETVEYKKFAKLFNGLDMDIAIAPLVSNTFNSYKSPLKFFEYSANAFASVFSDVEPYNSIIKHKKNGLLSKNNTLSWVENIELLINDSALREQISKQAQELIRTEYLLSKNSYKWREAFNSISRLAKDTQKNISLSLKQLKDINLQFVERSKSNEKELFNSQEQVDTLQKEYAALEKQKNTLQKEYAAIEKQKNTLQKKYVALEEQKNTLQTQIVSLEGEKSELFNRIGQLTSEINAYALSKSWRITRLFRKIKKHFQRKYHV